MALPLLFGLEGLSREREEEKKDPESKRIYWEGSSLVSLSEGDPVGRWKQGASSLPS